ncbi:hypothetical protein CMI37_30780 [Candidatus Pacearchaeota archaeon]|nr:hypothetical protein [Candidatus Pacearchaeota archaeon]|tara:strand:+ start:376 stop:771 length:396 start_codon:yes stop_codon:yes gene_type:complete
MAMTFTYDDRGSVKTITATWTSDGSGDAAATTKRVYGTLIKGVTNPSATAPTANYDIVVTDEQSLDVLGQSQDDLMNRHTSSTEQAYFFLLDYAGTPLAQSAFPPVADKLTVTVSNAGDTKSGVLVLYYRS